MKPLTSEPETLTALLAEAVKKVEQRWPEDTPGGKFFGDAWEWVDKHPQAATEALQEGADGLKSLGLRVRSHLTLKARQNRAQRLGYATEDEAFYSPGLISTLLPIALDPDGLVSPPQETEPRRSKGDPATGGSLAAMVMDVRRAFGRLNGWHATFVYARYVDNLLPDQIAVSYHVPRDNVDEALGKALRWMSDFLGGSPGRGCDEDCECMK